MVRARELRREGRIDEAIAAYETALDATPQDAGLWGEIASAYNRGKQRELAAAAYAQALEFGGPNADYHVRLAIVQQATDHLDDALDNLRLAAAIRPLAPREHAVLLQVLSGLGRPHEAASTLEAAWAKVEGRQQGRELAPLGMGLVLAFGDDQQARQWLERALWVFADDPYALKRALFDQLTTDAHASRFLEVAAALANRERAACLAEVVDELRRLHRRRLAAFGPGYELDSREVRRPRSPLVQFWQNNWCTEDVDDNRDEELILAADEFGYLHWPTRLRSLVRGKRVLDVGGGFGVHGIGFVVNGALRYVGVDTRVELDNRRCRDKGPSPETHRDFPATPRQIMARLPRISIHQGDIVTVDLDGPFDVAVLHNVTEHLADCAGAFARLRELLAPGGVIVFHHHNFYAWDGHHKRPKLVSEIDPEDAEHRRYYDWAHLALPDDEVFARGLNKIRLADLRQITERHFDVLTWQELLPPVDKGLGRLTPQIQARHPELDAYELSIKNVLCVARRRE